MAFALYICLVLQSLVCGVLAAQESLYRRVQARSDALKLPLHAGTPHFQNELEARSPADNTTFGGGATSASFAEDRQSYFALIQVAGVMHFRVSLDSGSSDLWIVSSDCATEACRKTARYPLPYQSSTFLAINQNTTDFRVRYADGTYAYGFVAQEAISFAGFTVSNQTFGLVRDTNVTLPDQLSGVLGLGFPRLSSLSTSVPEARPFFHTLAEQARLEYPLFGLSLTRNATGTLTLGAVDSTVVKSVKDISWHRVAQFSPFGSETNASSYLQWAIQLNAFSVNTTQFTPVATHPQKGQGVLALLDIGAAGIYGPYRDVAQIFSLIDGARLVDVDKGAWAVPCTTKSTISFLFGTKTYTLQPIDYLIGPVSGNPNFCLSWPRATPPSNDGIDWQLGNVFLRSVYTVFSYGINYKEPPMIGLYSSPAPFPLSSAPAPQSSLATTPSAPTTDLSSFFSAHSATITTTLPNFVLPIPTFSTPPLIFNTSVPARIGATVTSGLANSTYSPIFADRTDGFNYSAIPTISPTPVVLTMTTTDQAGSTTITTFSAKAIPLGLPGYDGSAGFSTYAGMSVLSAFAIPAFLVIWTMISRHL